MYGLDCCRMICHKSVCVHYSLLINSREVSRVVERCEQPGNQLLVFSHVYLVIEVIS